MGDLLERGMDRKAHHIEESHGTAGEVSDRVIPDHAVDEGNGPGVSLQVEEKANGLRLAPGLHQTLKVAIVGQISAGTQQVWLVLCNPGEIVAWKKNDLDAKGMRPPPHDEVRAQGPDLLKLRIQLPLLSRRQFGFYVSGHATSFNL